MPSVNESRRAWLALLLLALGGVVWWQHAGRQDQGAPTAAPASGAANAGTPSPASLPSSRATLPPAEPLPPKDAPIDDIAGALEARAIDGDSRAQCRLAVELLRCVEIDIALTHSTFPDGQNILERVLETDGQFDQADRWAEQQIWQIRQKEQCQRLPESLHARGWELLRAAALAGEPEAMLRYAEGRRLQAPGQVLLQHPGLDDWRREAPLMVERAFQAGHREAVLMLIYGHTFKHDAFSGVIPDDPQRALALEILSSRLRGVGMPPLERFNATQVATAMRQAETWHTTYFQGRIDPQPTHLGKTSPLALNDPGTPPPCE